MPRNELSSQVVREETAKENSNSTAYVYREVPGLDADRLDILEQLKANLDQLEDLHGRLRFVMAEVRGVLNKA